MHIFCGNLNKKAPYYICEDHENADKDMEAYDKKIKKTLQQEKLLDCEDSSVDDDDSYLIKPPAPSTSNLKRRRSNSSNKTNKRKQQKTTQQVMFPPTVPDRKRSNSTSSNDSDIEILPFKLQDPVTKEISVMPVGPLAYDFELTPSFELEGLALQANEILKNRPEEQGQQKLPKIMNQFSLKSLNQSTNNEEVIEILSDSE